MTVNKVEWSLSNGFSILLMKDGKNKNPSLFVREPGDNVYIGVGSIKNPELLKRALSFYGDERCRKNF